MQPNVFLTDYGQEEAKARFAQDPRKFAVMTKRFVGEGKGHVTEIHGCRVEWVEKNGGLTPREIPDTQQVFPADLVLLAMGYEGPENELLEELGVEQDAGSNAKTGPGSYATSVPGVFAAGDMRRGQSLVVWAIREGREAARQCDLYLMGQD
jgi:glutamate synthase (NADPH/NADH) small chain